MAVSKRAFGAEIPVHVKKKLEARQHAAAMPVDPLDTVMGSRYYGKDSEEMLTDRGNVAVEDLQYDDLLNNPFGGIAELSSRKPFARLWTAIMVKEIIDEGDNGYPKKLDDYSGDDDEAKLKSVERELATDSTLYYDTINKRVNKIITVMNKPHIYEIGNHNKNVLSNERPLNSIDGETIEGSYMYDDIFPPELADGNTAHSKQLHHFNAPPGITKVSSETQGAFGQTVKTTVDFKCFSLRDFERIYSRYFLRPAAQVILDMGWSSVSELYKPSDIMVKGMTEEILYGDEGIIQRYGGDLKVFIGNVINFDSKITPDGIECSLEFVSKNTALLSAQVNTATIQKLKTGMDIEVMRWAASFYGSENKPYNDKYGSGVADGGFIATTIGNWSQSTQSEDEVRELMQRWSYENASSKSKSGLNAWVPGENGRRLGIFQAGDKSENKLFVSFGWLEDNILNVLFGNDNSKVNKIKNNKHNEQSDDEFMISFDSSNAFVAYSQWITKMQPHKRLESHFLYPQNWDATSDSKMTYNMKLGKVPDDRRANNVFIKSPSSTTYTNKDLGVGKIPIRECFISVEAVKSAMTTDGSMTAKTLIGNILAEVKSNTHDLIDLSIRSTDETGTKYEIFDKTLGLINEEEQSDWFDEMFIFDGGSPTTQVKSFDMSFTMPEGNLSNQIAIQQMSGKTSMTPLSSLVDDACALEQILRENHPNLVLEYVPNVGDDMYRKMLEREMGDAKDNAGGVSPPMFANPGIDKQLKKTDTSAKWQPGMRRDSNTQTYKRQSIASTNDSMQMNEMNQSGWADGLAMLSGGRTDGYGDVEDTEYDAQREAELALIAGENSTSSVVDYYMIKARIDIFKRRKNLLPVELTLSLYGVGSIPPGCIFRMSYIPKIYWNNTYFQVMNVTDELDQSGWTTTLKAQMRIRDIKKKGQMYKSTGAKRQVQPNKKKLLTQGDDNNTNAVDDTQYAVDSDVDNGAPLVNYDVKTSINSGIFSDGEWKHLQLKPKVYKNMKNIQIIDIPADCNVDAVFTFETSGEFNGEFGRTAIYRVHNEGRSNDATKKIWNKLKESGTYGGKNFKGWVNQDGNIYWDDDGWEYGSEWSYTLEIHPNDEITKKNAKRMVLVKGMRVLIMTQTDMWSKIRSFGKFAELSGYANENWDRAGSKMGDSTTVMPVYD